MKLNIFESYDEMSAATADFVAGIVKKRPNSLITLPSGDTPTKTLKNLVAKANAGEISFDRTSFVGLDEWVGMDKDSEGSCQHYIYDNFFNPLNIKSQQITFFNAMADDLTEECEKIDKHIASHGPLDLVLIGVGVNGHIGLNEPGTSFTSFCHTIDLEESTKTIAQKYFSGSHAVQEGITLGVAHLMNARTIVLIANGMKKANIIQKIVEGSITESVPGSILQIHKNCHFFLDREAASLLQRSN